MNFSQHAIPFGVESRHADSFGIGVKSINGAITELGRGNRQNAGPGADVQKRLPRVWPPRSHQLFQTKLRRGMLAGAETQARIEDDHRLMFAWPAFAPTRFDEQR